MEKIKAINTLTNKVIYVSDEVIDQLLVIHDKVEYIQIFEGFTRLFIPIEEDEKSGHEYLINDKIYTTLYTNDINELKTFKLEDYQMSLF